MIDTKICIYLMQHNPPEVLARFEKLQLGDVVMSVVTFAELQFGVARLPFDSGESAQAG